MAQFPFCNKFIAYQSNENYAEKAPLGRTVTTEEVGNVAAFLCSNLASGITGEITFVDAGFNIAALPVK